MLRSSGKAEPVLFEIRSMHIYSFVGAFRNSQAREWETSAIYMSRFPVSETQEVAFFSLSVFKVERRFFSIQISERAGLVTTGKKRGRRGYVLVMIFYEVGDTL